MTYIPRFHPLIGTFGGIKGWWIADSCAMVEGRLQHPYTDEPCKDHDEAVELCAMLNESEPDPREEKDIR